MIGKVDVKDFDRLCPKDWGKYDPRSPVYMNELNREQKDVGERE